MLQRLVRPRVLVPQQRASPETGRKQGLKRGLTRRWLNLATAPMHRLRVGLIWNRWHRVLARLLPLLHARVFEPQRAHRQGFARHQVARHLQVDLVRHHRLARRNRPRHRGVPLA